MHDIFALITHPHIAPRSKKVYSYNTTSPQEFHALFQGGLYLLCTMKRELCKCKSYYSCNAITINHLMLYREIIAVCSQIHTKHINTLCGLNIGSLNVKLVVHFVTIELLRVNIHVNTLRLCYKNQSVNAVLGNNRCLF
jgi:hypothetical protein